MLVSVAGLDRLHDIADKDLTSCTSLARSICCSRGGGLDGKEDILISEKYQLL